MNELNELNLKYKDNYIIKIKLKKCNNCFKLFIKQYTYNENNMFIDTIVFDSITNIELIEEDEHYFSNNNTNNTNDTSDISDVEVDTYSNENGGDDGGRDVIKKYYIFRCTFYFKNNKTRYVLKYILKDHVFKIRNFLLSIYD